MSATSPKAAASRSALQKLERKAEKRLHATRPNRDPIGEIRERDRNISPADRQRKYAKMAVSEFCFFRGTNFLFWEDLGRDRRIEVFGSDRTRTWIQGDLHSENFGAYDNAAGKIAYSINDFDETIVADYQYDLWRMATSIATVARDNSIAEKRWGEAIDAFTLAYLDEIDALVGNDDETRRYFTADNTYGKLDDFLRDVAENESREKMLDKWLTKVGQSVRFDIDGRPDKLAPVTDEERAAIAAAFPVYGKTLSGKLNYSKTHFRIVDIARRLDAGIGSLGTPRYYVAIAGRDAKDRRLLDLKRQEKPSAYKHIRKCERRFYDATFAHDAERHAIAYRATTLHTDDYLGWIELPDGAYSVRERSPYKETFDTTVLKKFKSLRKLCEQWGKILATCHSRADHNYDAEFVPHSFEDEVQAIVKGKEALFCQLVRDVALNYLEIVSDDWQTFIESDLCAHSSNEW
ncbi:MAG: DUF2252 domain-containing protein [Geitlerinemataceae cyanobacterium]